MTMDIKDIIKWFIPCFHILQKLGAKWILIYLLLFLNKAACSKINSELVLNNNLDSTKKIELSLVNNDESKNFSQSAGFTGEILQGEEPSALGDTSVGRTFGRPFMKKMMAGLLPVIFQVGAASTWAVVAALVGFKTLLVTLVILKLLLIAGAAKIGALFASKGHHHHQQWEPPHQKEIHLHIHNPGHEHHEEHVPVSSWSREGYTTDSKPHYVIDPYRAGPQTISTPYGNYLKIDSSPLLGPVTVSTT